DLEAQVVKAAGETELRPLHPVVDGDEIVVDVGVVPSPGARALRRLEAVRARHPIGLLRVPAEVPAEEHGPDLGCGERNGLAPELGGEGLGGEALAAPVGGRRAVRHAVGPEPRTVEAEAGVGLGGAPVLEGRVLAPYDELDGEALRDGERNGEN